MSRLMTRTARKLNRMFGVGITQTLFYEITGPTVFEPSISVATLTILVLPPKDVCLLDAIGGVNELVARERLKSGDNCYIGVLDGKTAHYAWVQKSGPHRVLPAGISLEVAPGDFWIYHCVTAGWARGRTIYPCVLQKIVDDYFQLGFSRARIYTTRENVASQKGIIRAGFTPTGTIHALRFGERYFHLPSLLSG